MAYETNVGGLGISKRYGIREGYAHGGVTSTGDSEFRFVAEITGNALDVAPVIRDTIPEGLAIIKSVKVFVEEAFTASDTVDVFVDGVTILTAPVAADSTGYAGGTLAVDPTEIDNTNEITLDVSGLTAGDGHLRVTVELERL